MGRYVPGNKTVLSASVESASVMDRHFDSLKRLLGYHQELSDGYGISNERLDVIESTLRAEAYMDSTALASLEDGFFLSREVALESAVGDGIKKVITFITSLIVKVFNFIMNVLTLGSWSKLTREVEDLIKSVDEAAKASAAENAEYEKKHGAYTGSVELEHGASFAPQIKARGYQILTNTINAVFAIFDSPTFKSVFEDPTRADVDAFGKGIEQGRSKAKGPIDQLNKATDIVPYQLTIDLDTTNAFFKVVSHRDPASSSHAVKVATNEYHAVLKQNQHLIQACSNHTKRLEKLNQQKDHVIKALNKLQAIPPSDASAYAETARCWAGTLQQLSALLNYTHKSAGDIATGTYKFV